MNAFDLLAVIVYPALFALFLILAILAVVDNVNRLRYHERVAFHLILALIFATIGAINPIAPVLPFDIGRRIVRLLAIPLILVMLPSTWRGLRVVLAGRATPSPNPDPDPDAASTETPESGHA